jgi:hypothetical protein
MKHKIAMFIFAMALFFAVGAAPVYAGGADCTDGAGDRACSGGGTDDGYIWSS